MAHIHEKYDFVSNPENFPKWAKNFCKSVNHVNNKWVAETPEGPVEFRFVKKNEYGILDHYVKTLDKEIFVPVRVVPNAEGSQIIFTLFQNAGMSDNNFEKDSKLVEQDLNNLKSLMEK